MSEERHEPGWWLGADGRWHPPGARTAPAHAPRQHRQQPTGPVDPVPGITERNWHRATPTPDATQRSAQPPRPVAPAAYGPPAGTAPEGAMSGFDDNPFAGHRRRRSGRDAAPLPKRGRLVLPLKILIILVVVAGVSALGFFLTHPSPLRSPDAVAQNFYQSIEKGQWTAALSDVAPAQRTAATGMQTLPEVKRFKSGLVNFSNLQVVNPTPPTATTASVQLQGCGADFSCSPLEAVPTTEVKGQWYVDFDAWDPTLTS